MRTRIHRASRSSAGLVSALTLAAALVPAVASAQFGAPERQATSTAVGERYHIEVSGTFWNPDLAGVISSEQFGLIGTDIDFVTDLGYAKTRFKDFRLVLRPSSKHRFRLQYTPVVYSAQTTFNRNIVFNGITFPLALPVDSAFGWKVWRIGYEYDFIYKPRGFVGMLLEVRHTDFSAELASPLASEFTSAKGPLPAIGLVGRAYPIRELALNFEVSGFKVPDIDPKYQANYFDWDIYGTVNLSEYAGVQFGWRKMSTFLNIEKDKGDIKFQGIWFGAALRY